MTHYDGPYDARICAHASYQAHDAECDLRAERDSLATQLEQTRRERDEAHEETLRERREYEAEVQGMRRDLAEARATNARLHRRAQGVEASKPDDADLIRRLRADVRGQAKHAGYVAGYVMRLRCALSDAQHARDADARAFNAALDREHARLLDAERERDDARAKLAAALDVVKMARRLDAYDWQCRLDDSAVSEEAKHDARELSIAIFHYDRRIIDEKEGGQ